MNPSASWRVLRFGPFEADVQSGELRKQGFKVRLQGQPFEILLMLLDRPGQVVTRQELGRKEETIHYLEESYRRHAAHLVLCEAIRVSILSILIRGTAPS